MARNRSEKAVSNYFERNVSGVQQLQLKSIGLNERRLIRGGRRPVERATGALEEHIESGLQVRVYQNINIPSLVVGHFGWLTLTRDLSKANSYISSARTRCPASRLMTMEFTSIASLLVQCQFIVSRILWLVLVIRVYE